MVKLTAGPIDEHPFWGPAQFSGAFAAGFTPPYEGSQEPKKAATPPSTHFFFHRISGPEKNFDHFKAVATRAKNLGIGSDFRK